MPAHRVAWLAAVPALGCSVAGVSPVARYPWIEHAHVALAQERLTLDLSDDGVDVDAWFRFDGEGDMPERLDFAIGKSDGAIDRLVVTLERDDAPPLALDAAPERAPLVPVDGAIEARLVTLPSVEARRVRLRMRYRQSFVHSFRYVLQSGAYWSGPIGALEVLVRDPGRRIASARVEGREADVTEEGGLRWSFVDLEPRGGVVLEAR